MDITNIKVKYESLNQELKQALSRMERTDRVFIIRDAIKDLQKLCPHNNGNYVHDNGCIGNYLGIGS